MLPFFLSIIWPKDKIVSELEIKIKVCNCWLWPLKLTSGGISTSSAAGLASLTFLALALGSLAAALGFFDSSSGFGYSAETTLVSSFISTSSVTIFGADYTYFFGERDFGLDLVSWDCLVAGSGLVGVLLGLKKAARDFWPMVGVALEDSFF